MRLLENIAQLTFEMAPWLLLGLVAAAVIKVWLPDDLLARVMGRGKLSTVWAALVGAPLPLCSCGVLPVALSLRRQGASKGATVSFLVATPETGVDSVAVSYALLGPFFTWVRPVAAVLSAVASGLVVEWWPDAPPRDDKGADTQSSCCGGKGENADSASGCCDGGDSAAKGDSCCDDGCCGGDPGASRDAGASLAARLTTAFRYMTRDLLPDIAWWIAIGLVLAGVITTFAPAEWIAATSSGWGRLPAMLLMLAIGIPMYICATASTPVAASLLVAGLSPGTVLVFLLAGPATNLGSFGVVRQAIGTPATLAYIGSVAVMSLLLGYATDALVAAFAFDVVPTWIEADEHGYSVLGIACALVLAVLVAWPHMLKGRPTASIA